MLKRAVFFDRDGIINELRYYPEQGIIDSPFTAEQFRLTPFAITALKRCHDLGFVTLIVSNQPGIAKGHFSEETFNSIGARMRELIAKGGASLDGEYYCLHHPNAVRDNFRKVCDCRKPKPGLILKAAKEHDISLRESFFIGDGIIDVRAGNEAGCKTILVASVNDLLLKLLSEENAKPDYLVKTLKDAVILLTH